VYDKRICVTVKMALVSQIYLTETLETPFQCSIFYITHFLNLSLVPLMPVWSSLISLYSLFFSFRQLVRRMCRKCVLTHQRNTCSLLRKRWKHSYLLVSRAHILFICCKVMCSCFNYTCYLNFFFFKYIYIYFHYFGFVI